MKLFPWSRGAPRHDPKQQAAAEERLQRVMQGFQKELESLQEPAEHAAPGQMPEILSRPPLADGLAGSAPSSYPWEKQPDPEPPGEPRRRY